MNEKLKDVLLFGLLTILTIILLVVSFRLLKPQVIECQEQSGIYSIVPPMCNISNEQHKINELEERIEELEKELYEWVYKKDWKN